VCCPARVVLLAEHAYVVAQVQQPPEENIGLFGASDAVERVGQPEAAGEEGALLAGKPVRAAVSGGVVAQQEPVPAQLRLDGIDRADDPLVVER